MYFIGTKKLKSLMVCWLIKKADSILNLLNFYFKYFKKGKKEYLNR